MDEQEAKLHRRWAVDLYNQCWDLINAPASPERDEALERAAFASLFHWSKVGNRENLAIGEWMVAFAYLHIGRAEGAHVHAEKAVAISEAPFFLATAYAALARALALGGNPDGAFEVAQQAVSVAGTITDGEDRAVFDTQFLEEPWFGALNPQLLLAKD